MGAQRHADYLLEGVRLAEARSLADRNDIALRDEGQAFLHANDEAETGARLAELRQARRRQRTVASVAGVATGSAIAAVAAAILAFNGHQAAVSQTRLAMSRQLAALATSRLLDHPDVGMLRSVQALRIQPPLEAHEAEFSALQASPALTSFLYVPNDARSMTFSPDGRILASASGANADSTIRLWDVVRASRRDSRSMPGRYSRWRSVRIVSCWRRRPPTVPRSGCGMWRSNNRLVRLSPATHPTRARSLSARMTQPWPRAPAIGRCDSGTSPRISQWAGHCQAHRTSYSRSFGPNANMLSAIGYNGTVSVWDSTTGQPIIQFNVSNGPTCRTRRVAVTASSSQCHPATIARSDCGDMQQ